MSTKNIDGVQILIKFSLRWFARYTPIMNNAVGNYERRMEAYMKTSKTSIPSSMLWPLSFTC